MVVPAYPTVVVVVDSHVQRFVLATEEATVTQQVSHRPIKCQPCSWSQRGTTVNGLHHGDSPLLKPTGVQIATKPMPGTTNREHRKLIGVKTVSLFEYEAQFLLSGVLPVFQNLKYKLQRRLSDVLPNQQRHQKVCTVMHLRMLRYPIRLSTIVSSTFRAGVRKRRCGETVLNYYIIACLSR